MKRTRRNTETNVNSKMKYEQLLHERGAADPFTDWLTPSCMRQGPSRNASCPRPPSFPTSENPYSAIRRKAHFLLFIYK